MTVAFYEYITVGKEHIPGISESMGKWTASLYSHIMVPTFLAPGIGFVEDNFAMDWGWRNGLGMIQAHYIYCALYFYY